MFDLLGFFIFIIVLFFYLHIQYEYKMNNDLEVLTSQINNKENFEDICNLKQPTLFKYYNNVYKKKFLYNSFINKYKIFDFNIRNITISNKNNKLLHFPLNISKAKKLFQNDKKGIYITENNVELVNEISFEKNINYLSSILEPSFSLNKHIDLLSGSENSFTPLKYNLNSRFFLYIPNGSVEIKLIPPKFSSYLNEYKDYDNYEFVSDINIWNTSKNNIKNIKKIKQLSFKFEEDSILYIPPHWWYSMKFNKENLVLSLKYSTFINILANLKNYLIYYLQKQNINEKTNNVLEINKKKVLKK